MWADDKSTLLLADTILLCTATGKRSGSLTLWKKCCPSLFSSLKITPFFVAKYCFFSTKQPLFRHETLTFQINLLFCSKILIFQPKWTPIFTVKNWTSKLTPFPPNSQRWVPKYPLFLGKCESWISSKNTIFGKVVHVWVRELRQEVHPPFIEMIVIIYYYCRYQYYKDQVQEAAEWHQLLHQEVYGGCE